jgi:hypothetical protein
MALQKQVVSIPIVKGVDSKTDNKQEEVGSIDVLENIVFTTVNETNKRPGYTGLAQDVVGSATAISSGRGLTTFKDELLMNSDGNLYSYSEGADRWVNKGAYVNCEISSNTVIRNSYQQTCQDSCYHTIGIQCFVWEDSVGGSRYTIVDYETKQQIVANGLVSATAQKPKCFALGSYIVILYYDTSLVDLVMLRIPAATPTTTPASTTITNDAVDSVYDAMVISERLFVCYNNATSAFCQFYINSFLTVSSVRSIAATTATSCAVFGDDSQNAWFAFYDGTNVKTCARSYDLPSTFVVANTTVETVATVRNITGAVVGTTATIIYEISNGTAINYRIRKNTITTAAAVGSAASLIRSLFLAGKAFVYNDVIYFAGGFASDYQPTYFLLNSSGSVAAKVAPLSGGGLTARVVIPQFNEIETGIFQWAYLQKSNANAVDGLIVSQSGVTQGSIDFTSTGLITQEIGSNLLVCGGYLAEYDGANFTEHGFNMFPEACSLGQSAAAGSIANGTYLYSITYEWFDNFGQIHRSAPSVPTSITTTGGNNTVTATIPSLRVTAKSNVIVSVYRTTASGTVYYRISSFTSPTFNSTSADTVSFVDTFADASIIGNEILYTTGGEVENISCPATNILTSFKNRAIAIPSENPYQWWYTKQVVPGFPAEFSDLFVGNIDELGGPVTAIGALDDKLILFKESVKFYVYGDGPAPSGANNTFSEPDRVTSDGGCVNQRSIVSTPMGLMYQSLKGIYLLDRSLTDQYIGDKVEEYTASASVTSAVLVANVNQVRFTISTGEILVYDYYVKQWYVFTNLAPVDAVNSNAQYCLVKDSGQVLRESADLYTDAGAFIQQKIKTAWINLANVQGFQRVYKILLLGEYKSPHRLRVQIAKDFNPNPVQEVYITASGSGFETENWGDDATWGSVDYWGGEWPAYQFRIFLEQQKCESIQITIEESQSSDFGQGFALSNIGLEFGIKQGLNKLASGKSYG